MRLAFSVFVLILSCLHAFSQVYPVQGTAALIPPYALRLSDYSTSVSERFVLNVLLADVTRAELQVRLRLSISSQNVKLETKPEYLGSPLTLQGAIPLRLTNVELADYFNPDHLNFSGISKSEFLKTGFLPEGFYQFCFEVYEYHRNVKISNAICAPAWLIINDPPIVNLPRSGEKIKPLNPQNIIFQWTPRHTGSPNSAFTSEYDIKLVEVWPSTRNPNDAILSQPAIYETTTHSTTFIYGPDATPLELGRSYAFRVQARAMAGTQPLDLFKNNGYSETVAFKYGDACEAPTGVAAQAPTSSKITLQWEANPLHTGYRVQFRVKGQDDEHWYPRSTLVPTLSINDLEPKTTYEYQVMAKCGAFESVFGNISSIATPDKEQKCYTCGKQPGTFDLSDKELSLTLKAGDVVYANDFDVTLTKVSGGNGIFSGEGATVIPFLNNLRVKVKFTDIKVNKARRMVDGYMDVVRGVPDVIQKAAEVVEEVSQELKEVAPLLNEVRQFVTPPPDADTFVADEQVTIKEGVQSAYRDVALGRVIIVDKNGKTHDLPANKNLLITDSSGSGVIVDKNGGVANVTPSEADKISKRGYDLNLAFENSVNSKYGIDIERIDEMKKNYERLGNYVVPFKAVAVGIPEEIIAQVKAGIDPSQIKFDQGGSEVRATVSRETINLTAFAKETGDKTPPLVARTKDEKTQKETIVGKLNVVGYEPKNLKLHIVPVNGMKFKLSASDIEKQLNAIYAPAVASWSVELNNNLTAEGLSTPFDNGSSGILSSYTQDMKTVFKAYTASSSLQYDDYYLFLVPRGSNASEDGFMPRSKQCGFIFLSGKENDTTPIIRTMAHELGHGAFTLKHTFDEYSALPKGSTDNLMDYGTGTSLLKYQWDQIHQPAIVLGLFEDDERGASVTKYSDTVGYVISDPQAYKRSSAPPYQISEPKEILTQGKEVALLKVGADGKMATIKILDQDLIHVTSSANISKIMKLAKPEKYQTIRAEECVVIPYSNDKTGHTPEIGSYVLADKMCGDFLQIKDGAVTNKGWWINKKSLKRVGDDVADNFDWMENVFVSEKSLSNEAIVKILANRTGVNDRTDKYIYGQNAMRPTGKGFFYLGTDAGYPDLSGTDFEKHLKKLILDELGKEGSYGSINTYDGEIFTWGKGFAIGGTLMDVFEYLLTDKSINAAQIFNNVGIQIVSESLWVLDDKGNWLKDIMPAKKKDDYKASNYIRSNKQLLSFFIELAEKKDYQKSIVNAQYKVFTESAGKYPDYIINKSNTKYDLNWSDESVTVLAHLSHWCGYSWSKYTYKDTNGDLDKILYKYIYNTAVLFPGVRNGAVLESNIYQWDGSNFYLLQRLDDFGIPKSIGLTTLEQKWSSHLIEIEFKADKSKKLRAVKKGTKNYVSNSESVLIPKQSGQLVLTKSSVAITYGSFGE